LKTRAWTSRTLGLAAVMAVCLAFPSTAKVQKFMGTVWVPVYLLGVFAALLVACRYVLGGFLGWLTEKAAVVLGVLTVVVLMGAFALTYPALTTGRIGAASDRDEALNTATWELLHGRYPYYPRAVVDGVTREGEKGSLISPLPGELLLAVPFVLLGNGAYQNFFWVLVLFFVVRWYLRSGPSATAFLWGLLLLSPICLHEVVTGGDLMSNTIWVLVFALFMIRCVSDARTKWYSRGVAAALFGIGLSSRANFVLIGPLVLSVLIQAAGWKPALKYMTLAALASLAVTLPFYLYDPAGFSPLHTYNKLRWFESTLPHAGVVVPVVGAVLAGALSFQKMAGPDVRFLRNCAIVLAWPVVCVVALSSVSTARLELYRFAWYGQSFMLFGVLACWVPLAGEVGAAARTRMKRAQ